MRGFQIWLRITQEESLVGMRCWLGGNIRLGSKILIAQLQAVGSIRKYTLLLQKDLSGSVNCKIVAWAFTPTEQFHAPAVPSIHSKNSLTLLIFVRAHLGIRRIFVTGGLTSNRDWKFCIYIVSLGK